ncbi:hypothetical protein [Lysobacter gummosus]
MRQPRRQKQPYRAASDPSHQSRRRSHAPNPPSDPPRPSSSAGG